MPMGVRTPVESMSMRPLMGMVHALTEPGICSARSISSISSSHEMCSGQMWPRKDFSRCGAHEEYQRSFARHSAGGFSTTVVSIIESGAGSVDVSARPALPKTQTTSGNDFRMRSCVSISRWASVTDMPGTVVGM